MGARYVPTSMFSNSTHGSVEFIHDDPGNSSPAFTTAAVPCLLSSDCLSVLLLGCLHSRLRQPGPRSKKWLPVAQNAMGHQLGLFCP